MRALTYVAFMLALATRGFAADGVQLLPDQTAIVVNKDVGTARWGISLSLDDSTPLNASGSVYDRNGGATAFLWCEIRDVIGSTADIGSMSFQWACFVSDPCTQSPCGVQDWRFVDLIRLPGSFFLPR